MKWSIRKKIYEEINSQNISFLKGRIQKERAWEHDSEANV
jgi:hypothetical protein